MQLHIVHSTTYRYHRPVNFGRHRLVLRPREGHDLRVVRMALQLEPANRVNWVRDVFGNSIAIVDWTEPATALTIVNDVVVERPEPIARPASDESGVDPPHVPWDIAFPPQYDALESDILAAYLSRSFPLDAEMVRSWLTSLRSDPADAEGTMVALCGLVAQTVAYRRREEKGVQSPGRTLELRTGSCRDMATLMMDAARALGVAARFASGYLHSQASMDGRGSTHAWTEVYLPALGWRGFDPTTGHPVSVRHVVTGVSNNPRGVMPVSGAFIGTASDYNAMQVTVRTEERPLDKAE